MNHLDPAQVEAERRRLVDEIISYRCEIAKNAFDRIGIPYPLIDRDQWFDEDWDLFGKNEFFLEDHRFDSVLSPNLTDSVRRSHELLRRLTFYCRLSQARDELRSAFVNKVVASTSDPHCPECLADLFRLSVELGQVAAELIVPTSEADDSRSQETYPKSAMSR